MAAITRFEEIEAWKNACQLAKRVYELTGQGSFARDFGLRDQIRGAAVRVMSNIAEGFESRTQGLFIDFLGRAKGSVGEIRSQLCVALDQGYISQAQFDELYGLADKAGRQVYRFMRYLQSQPNISRVREEHVEHGEVES